MPEVRPRHRAGLRQDAEGKRARCAGSISPAGAADLAFIRRERFTPVFVLIDNGREIGRIRGYPGESFWGLLANLIAKLPE